MNKPLERARARKIALTKANREILDKAGEAGLSEEQQTAFDTNAAEIATVEGRIAREEALAKHELEVAAFYTPPDQPSVGPVRAAWQDDPNKGFKRPQDFFLAVLTASQPGRRVEDDRLRYLATAGSDEAGTYSDPYGGFLVPSGFIPNLMAISPEGDPTAGLVQNVPMATPSIKIPVRTDKTHTTSVSGGLVVYRRSETQAVTATRTSFEQVQLDATPMMGLSYASEELLTDSAISFAALIERGFRDEFSAKILYEKIHGTGAGTLEGVLLADCTVSVAKETGQAADTITYQNLVKMRARSWGYSRAIWLYNQDCLPQLMQIYQPIGTTGVPMWQTSARDGEPDRLFGRPAYASEFLATIGDTGDILLGTWSEYLYGVRQQLESAESMHVRFEYNERTFRFLMRNAGACWWRAAMTPKKSAATLSPFVKLDAR